MKKFKLMTLILIFGIFSLCSCSKSSTNPKQGDIKITAHYNPHHDAYFYYSLSGSVKIELFQSGNSKGVQYGNGTDAVDFGNFDYGSYTVKASYSEEGVWPLTGETNSNDGNKSQDISVSSNPSIIDIEIP